MGDDGDRTVVLKKSTINETRTQQSQEYRHAVLYSGDSDEGDIPENELGESAADPNTASGSRAPVAHIRPTDIKKDGYLQKQGGVQQNQGWKKRWFVFDGKSLKYFPNRQSVVSLRIIPVAIMENVELYEEDGQTSLDILPTLQREHKFVLKCRNRKFLFGTNDPDNSHQWKSYLRAAIQDYKRSKNDYIPQGEMNNPDISGPMKLNSNRNDYIAALKGKTFRYYYNDRDYDDDSPIHELSMELTNVFEISGTSLKLESPMLDQCITLHFNTEVESSAWKIAFEDAISNCLGDNMIVDEVRQVEGNKRCADCTSHETLWASINLGIVLCPKCAGIHRSLGVHISKIKSLRMDKIFRNDTNVLQLILGIGNEKSNKILYRYPPAGRPITNETPSDIRKRHITIKYVEKAFADRIPGMSQENLNENLITAIKKNDICLAIKCLHSGASIMQIMSTTPSANDRNAFVFAEENGHSLLKEYLTQNLNTDVSLPFNNLENLKIDSDVNKSFSEVRRKGIYLIGSLEKTGANMRGFKRRWCVLHYGQLTYYDNEEMTTKKGCIDMKDIVCVTQVEERTIVRDKQFCFDISHKPNKRIYRFSCADDKSCKEWMVAIAKVISPLEIDYESFSLVGYFFIKLEQGIWRKMWLVLQRHNMLQWNLETHSQEEPIILTRDFNFRVENKGKFSAVDESYIDQKKLHGNQRIEVSSKTLPLSVSIQGLLLKDTERLVTLVKLIVT